MTSLLKWAAFYVALGAASFVAGAVMAWHMYSEIDGIEIA